MSVFNEITTKIDAIGDGIFQSFLSERNRIFERLEKCKEEYFNECQKRQSKVKHTLLSTLQSINEDGDEGVPILKNHNVVQNSIIETSKSPTVTKKILPETENEKHARAEVSEIQNDKARSKRVSKKRVAEEVDGINSPEMDKRQKRSASVKAQTNISKQVNLNLMQKLRRDDPQEKPVRSSRRRARDNENKENMLQVVVKQEKISLPSEEMEIDPQLDIEVKKEVIHDIEMPPPPVPRPRRVAKQKVEDKAKDIKDEEGEYTQRRSRAKTTKQTDVPNVPLARTTRSSSRAIVQDDTAVPIPPQQETRPKRTKKGQNKEDTQQPLQSGIDAPEMPRTKRTKRGPQKNKEKQDCEDKDPPPNSSKEEPEKPEPEADVKEKDIQEPNVKKPENNMSDIKDTIKIKDIPLSEEKLEKIVAQLYNDNAMSPILTTTFKMNYANKTKESNLEKHNQQTINSIHQNATIDLEKTGMITQMNETVTLTQKIMECKVVLTNGQFNHDPATLQAPKKMDETIILKRNDSEMITEQTQFAVMDQTVVLDKKAPRQSEIMSEDNSLLTDDNSEVVNTPPRVEKQEQEAPKSAVKEKVQQFEEMATRMTRTKTRALVKQMEETNETPPDKTVPAKPVLSAETLLKMNNMIFNGKPPMGSCGTSKPKFNNVVSAVKSFIPSSASKESTASKVKEAEREKEEAKKKEKEDARKKKEALLQAKREEQRRKRDQKIAAAAAVREAAEKERQLALEAAARERMEKQAHVDQGKLERQREVERKKQELARKVAETEERRRAEELARQLRLQEEQKKAQLARKKQQEEHEATKREVAMAAKEIEKRQKEYMEKQKMKQRFENDKLNTPLRTPGTSGIPFPRMDPVRMSDGFQYLNSDNDEDDESAPKMPVPQWCMHKERQPKLHIQSRVKADHIRRLFSVRRHTPDLKEIFPNIKRQALKRTSSAVWRTPPNVRQTPE